MKGGRSHVGDFLLGGVPRETSTFSATLSTMVIVDARGPHLS